MLVPSSRGANGVIAVLVGPTLSNEELDKMPSSTSPYRYIQITAMMRDAEIVTLTKKTESCLKFYHWLAILLLQAG